MEATSCTLFRRFLVFGTSSVCLLPYWDRKASAHMDRKRGLGLIATSLGGLLLALTAIELTLLFYPAS
jgi:hypothetical protein